MNPLLAFIWERLKHLSIYILVLAVLIGGPYLLYRRGYNKGYNQSTIDHPTNVFNAPAIVVQNPPLKGFGLHIGRGVLGYTYQKETK